MNVIDWRAIRWLRSLLATQQPEPEHQAKRIVAMLLHIVLPAKAGVIAVALYYVFFSNRSPDLAAPHTVVVQFLKGFFIAYLCCNVLAAVILALWRKFQPGIFQWLAFTLGLLDGLFMSGMVFITGGFESVAFWIFPGMIVLNALSIPLAAPQLVLNILLSFFYLGAGLLEASLPPPTLIDVPSAAVRPSSRNTNTTLSIVTSNTASRSWMIEPPYSSTIEERAKQPVFLSLFVLWLLASCCYGMQILAERQRRVAEEERESAVRQAQLHSAGRLAAEFAHQIKNPLAIINNTTFSIKKALNAGRTDFMRQIEIIQEEVERSDRVVTQIMGYAQLTEGRVEKLNVAEELDSAIDQVFPGGMDLGIRVERAYTRNFPPLLMQKRHLADILVNLLLNAREALNGHGTVSVSAVCRPDYSVEISVHDSGPGVPPDKVEQIFEAYYSTKEKGTGLGLAIVKHNAELYAGTVRLESGLGNGARFILTFPAKTVISAPK
jgi:signal transduction histidine kinase